MQAESRSINRLLAGSSDQACDPSLLPITVAPQPDFRMLPKDKFGKAKTLALITATGAVALPVAFTGILILLSHAPHLGHLIGTVFYALTSNTITRFLISVFPNTWIFWVPLVLMIINRLTIPPPTHLEIFPDGLVAYRTNDKTAFRHKREIQSFIGPDGRTFNPKVWCWNPFVHVLATIGWFDLVRVSVERKSSVSGAQIVCFHMKDGKTIKLKLGDVLTQEVRIRLSSAFKNFAPDAQVDPEVYDLLEPRPETSFTELWISALSAAPVRERIASLIDGTKLNEDRYKIIERLTSGGQGTLYIAKDLQDKSSTTIVIKEYVLPIHVTREAKKHSIESLEKEACLLKKLDNSRIVKLLDFFIEDHRGYLVFEHVKGSNLRSLIESSGPMPEGRVREILKEMLEILTYLHSQDPPLVHRDFTPDNLIYDETNGRVKLIDFNVAQVATDTINAIVVGKRSYMPPEQFRGKAVPESDLYALGACIYFLLTGEEPEPLSILHPKNHNQSISQDLDDLVAKCTQLNVDARYHSAKEISARLT